jgi:hypothetical protein
MAARHEMVRRGRGNDHRQGRRRHLPADVVVSGSAHGRALPGRIGATSGPWRTPACRRRAGCPCAGRVGSLRLEGLPVPDHVHAAAKAFRYHRRVLVAPPGQLPAARHATGHAGGTCVVWPPLWAIVISASGGGELRYERYSPGVGSVSLCGGGGIWDRHSDSVRF